MHLGSIRVLNSVQKHSARCNVDDAAKQHHAAGSDASSDQHLLFLPLEEPLESEEREDELSEPEELPLLPEVPLLGMVVSTCCKGPTDSGKILSINQLTYLCQPRCRPLRQSHSHATLLLE